MKKECKPQNGPARLDTRKFQQNFFRRAGRNITLLSDMFEQIPNAGFYIKDLQGRIVDTNRRSREYCNQTRASDSVGKRSCDLFPPDLASPVMESDRWVAKHGRPILNLRALSPDRYRMNSISIFPVKDARGKTIGTAGCFYRLNDSETSLSTTDLAIESAVSTINKRFAEPLPLAELAKAVGLSPATFIRNFTKTMKMPPGRYILNTRINRACLLLETTDRHIADIAVQVGFCDQSHFIRTFKKIRAMTPSAYRRRHRSISK